MKVSARVHHASIEEEVGAEIARDVTQGIREGTEVIKQGVRRMTAAGWKGNRLPKAWRGKVYPEGKPSMEAAGFVKVTGNAADIIESGLTATTIRAKGGTWLAIPTKEAGKYGIKRGASGAGVTTNKRGAREKITPGGFERRSGMKLRFIYEKGGRRAFLVADKAMLSRGIAAPYRPRGRGSKLYGPEGQTIVIFTLVPQVRTRKRMDLGQIAELGLSKAAAVTVSIKR